MNEAQAFFVCDTIDLIDNKLVAINKELAAN